MNKKNNVQARKPLTLSENVELVDGNVIHNGKIIGTINVKKAHNKIVIKDDFIIDFEDVIGYIGTSKILIIPNGVKGIAYNAFSDLGLEEVIIPRSVYRIGDNSFQNNNISKITFLSKIILLIGVQAFQNNKLEGTLTINCPIGTIGASAFSYNNLSNIKLEKGTRVFGSGCFSHNPNLHSVETKSDPEWIGVDIFDKKPKYKRDLEKTSDDYVTCKIKKENHLNKPTYYVFRRPKNIK